MAALLGLMFCLFCGGCLISSPTSNRVEVDIMEKKMGPTDLGECNFQTLMAVRNNGTADVRALSILVELYDPGAQKVAAWESIPVGEIRSGETKNVTSRLQTHCRTNYTLRAYALY
jgi:hypothetical protein